jgi:predicted RNase H-like HicB family nuclease
MLGRKWSQRRTQLLDVCDKDVLKVQVTVVIEPDADSFHAYTPALKGIHVDGKSVEEALNFASEAVEAYVDSLIRHGEPLPLGPDLSHLERGHTLQVPKEAFLHRLTVQCPSRNTSGTK